MSSYFYPQKEHRHHNHTKKNKKSGFISGSQQFLPSNPSVFVTRPSEPASSSLNRTQTLQNSTVLLPVNGDVNYVPNNIEHKRGYNSNGAITVSQATVGNMEVDEVADAPLSPTRASVQDPVKENGINSNNNSNHLDQQKDTSSDKKHKNPFIFCKYIAAYPKAAFGLTLGAHLLTLLVSGILLASGYDLYPAEFLKFPLDLVDDSTYKRMLAWQERENDDLRVVQGDSSHFLPPYPRFKPQDRLELFYRSEDSNILTGEFLREMQQLESDVYVSEGMQGTCVLLNETFCSPPVSLTNYFDGSLTHIDPALYDPEFNDVPAILFRAYNNTETRVLLEYHLSKEAVITKDSVYAELTRSMFLIGTPLNLSNFDQDDNWEGAKAILAPQIKPLLEDAQDDFNSRLDVELSYYAYMLFGYDVLKQAYLDMLLAIGAVCFIFLFMLFQTRSLWVTSWAIVSIIFCFPATNLVYRCILDYRYFGYFHILSIFIILGIGADDVFVFYDTWRSTGLTEHESLAHRLSECYRRATVTMFFTSFTTAAAFCVSAFSPLLAVGSFGLFTSMLVIINYLSVIIFFPTVVVTHHIYFEHKKCCLCVPAEDTSAQYVARDVIDDQSDSDSSPGCRSCGCCKRGPWLAVIDFFSGPFYRLITHKVARLCFIIGLLVVVAGLGYSASHLKPENREWQIYKQSHNYGRANHYKTTMFVPNEEEEFVQVLLVWGLEEQDLSSCHKTAIDCPGVQHWDQAFDMERPEAQQTLLALCESLKQMSEEEMTSFAIRRDPISGEPMVDCFMNELDNHLKIYNATLPTKESRMTKFMSAQPDIYNITALPGNFFDYFGIALSHWLTGGYRIPAALPVWSDLVGERKSYNLEPIPALNQPDLLYGTRPRFVSIRVNTTLQVQSLGFNQGLPVYDKWEEFMQNATQQMPASLSGGIQLTTYSWHRIKVQKTLADSAIIGLGIGLACAFPVLLLATCNWLVGLLATLTLACVTVCVVGVIPLVGWELGVLVSLNLTLVVGLSVDYVVHLAEAYHLACKRVGNRRDRVRIALTTTGISVLSGAITTCGAALFMLFAQITFFVQFGLFMFCTVGFSLIFSLCLFLPTLTLIGPNYKCANLFFWRPGGCSQSRQGDDEST